jgi:hypothetical protein
MRDIAAGTAIGFSDRDSLTATNESGLLRTADHRRTVKGHHLVDATPTTDKANHQQRHGGISTTSPKRTSPS